MSYMRPDGMGTLDATTAQDWISSYLQPMEVQMDHLFGHVYVDLNQVFTTRRLSHHQKYAVLRQGVTDMEDVTMLGTSVESIGDMFKSFNSLSV